MSFTNDQSAKAIDGAIPDQKLFLAAAGKTPAVRAFCSQRLHDNGRRSHRHREDPLSASHSHRDRYRFLPAVSEARVLALAHLAVFYPHPGSSLRPWHAYAALFLLVAITALVFEARSRRYLLVGWLWFVGTLVPMLGLQPVGYKGMQGIADRYAYLPFIGLFIMICWGVPDLLLQASSRDQARLAHRPEPRRTARPGGAYPSPAQLLERQRQPVVAHLAGHRSQLAGGKQSRQNTDERRPGRRRHGALLPGCGHLSQRSSQQHEHRALRAETRQPVRRRHAFQGCHHHVA